MAETTAATDSNESFTSFDESTLPIQSNGSEPVKLPFRSPTSDATAVTPPELTEDQEAKYKQILDAVLGWQDLPTTTKKNSERAPLSENEQMWLTRECLLRYLRATKWHVQDALARLEKTMVWRREYGIEKHTSDYINVEMATGKMVVQGFDNNGRPCIYMDPSKQNTEKSPRQIEALVFLLERMIDIMEPSQESLALLVNFKSTKMSQAPALGQGKETLNILQNHYPERLGRAMIINIPFFINGFFKMITPFIDPITREKLKFNEDLRTLVPPTQLLRSFGGDAVFEYDHSIYWPSFMALANKRRELYRQRWVKGGKRIGEKESYLRSGDEKSISEESA
ncbi:hypothetical protein KEM56_001440 [Ascosphaera pollenicola]|nr:hypothetical protein KEM56_001440 [Ascosphaera pollenicola]